MSNLPRFTDADLQAGLRQLAPASAAQSQDLVRRFVDTVLRRTGVASFPPLASTVHGALESLNGPWDAGGVSRWFALDPALAARLLGASIDIPAAPDESADDLANRVRKLGPGLIRALLMSAAASCVRPRPEALGVVDVAAFGSHSLRAACVARALAGAVGYAHPEEAYLAGLFHDIGMLALAHALPGTCDALLRVDPSADPGEARERAGRFGTIHAEIGAALLESLRVSGAVCDAVLLHHSPMEDLNGTHAMVRILRSAEAICQKGAAEDEVRVAVDLLGLSRSVAQRAVEEADAAVARATERVDASAARGCIAGTFDSAAGAPAAVAEALLREHLLNASACAEAGIQLGGASSFASALERIARLLPAIAGVGRAVLFAAERPGEAPGAWCIGFAGVKRLGIDLPRPDLAGVIAHAFRAGTCVTSLEPPRGTRFVGLDLQVARALRAEALSALPVRTTAGGCVGVLVVGSPLGGHADARETRPVLQAVADAFGATLERLGAGVDEGGCGALEALRATTQHLVHEARNPLSIIKASVEVARRRAASGEDICGELDVFTEEIDRVCDIVNQIANADAADAARSGSVDVNRAIRELLVAYEEPLFRNRGFSVELDLAEGDPPIVGSARLVKQILLNLLKNASEAMELGGQVEIATADLVNVEGRMMVEITVSDSGPGLTPGAMARLFEPAAHGHGAGGRGLGLANSLRCVREMEGHLSCRSRPWDGATFAVLLPRLLEAQVARYRRTRQLGA